MKMYCRFKYTTNTAKVTSLALYNGERFPYTPHIYEKPKGAKY